ncbi:hypothetical protein PM082_007488 [Marasmius tenuissimus]|nr:hypothetical protein PM082_007488 [Marasmius tenuissimus]
MQHGKQFLEHRKMFQPAFGAQESLTFNNAITEEAQLLIRRLQHNAYSVRAPSQI